MDNPLEECCPGCERKGGVIKTKAYIWFKIWDSFGEKWVKVYYKVYMCHYCNEKFIYDDDPFQKAKDLGWVKG